MTNRIVQLVPWRDMLLALTEQGEVFQLVYDYPRVTPVAVTWFPGLPDTVRARAERGDSARP